jgi:glycosyltransferase involved in cell wall biosynthesis
VSVIMPAYQAEAYIGEAIESALAQDHDALELIIVDDGSTDRTAEIAHEVARGHERGHAVTVISRTNGGAGAARNTGVEHARGEFVAFHDADDLWPADRLSGQVAHLRANPRVGMVLGLMQLFTPAGVTPQAHSPRSDADGLVSHHPSTALVRRELFDSVGPFDESLRIGHDIDWMSRAKDAGAGLAHVDRVVLHYRVHPQNTTSDVQTNTIDMLRSMRSSVQRKRTAAAGSGDRP